MYAVSFYTVPCAIYLPVLVEKMSNSGVKVKIHQG